VEQNRFARAENVLEHRLRQIHSGDRRLVKSNGHSIVADPRRRLDSIGTAQRKDQQTSLRARVLEPKAQHRGDELLEVCLSRNGAQDLKHDCKIQLFDCRFDRACRIDAGVRLAEARIAFVELPHLAICAPPSVRGARFSQALAIVSKSRPA